MTFLGAKGQSFSFFGVDLNFFVAFKLLML